MRSLGVVGSGVFLFALAAGCSSSSSSGGSTTGGGGGGGGGGGSGTSTIGGIFTAAEPWTTDVSGVTKDARSDAIIASMVSAGGWGNGNKLQIDFSIPIFAGDSSTPRQTITAQAGNDYCYGGPDCDAVPLQMPIPANANIEGSTDLTCDTDNNDCHILVVATDEKKLYELYNSTKAGSGIQALGAFIWDLTKTYPDNLRGDQCTSADAAGFPIAGLLATADEVAAGSVKHAIRFILPNARMKKAVYVHPASHAGGPESTDANAPPYGIHLRLKSSFDASAFNTGEKVIIKTMQTYGMLLSDGGNIALTFADDRTTTAKWDTVGVTAQSFEKITVDDFEVVDLGAEVPVTNDCVRNP